MGGRESAPRTTKCLAGIPRRRHRDAPRHNRIWRRALRTRPMHRAIVRGASSIEKGCAPVVIADPQPAGGDGKQCNDIARRQGPRLRPVTFKRFRRTGISHPWSRPKGSRPPSGLRHGPRRSRRPWPSIPCGKAARSADGDPARSTGSHRRRPGATTSAGTSFPYTPDFTPILRGPRMGRNPQNRGPMPAFAGRKSNKSRQIRPGRSQSSAPVAPPRLTSRSAGTAQPALSTRPAPPMSRSREARRSEWIVADPETMRSARRGI
jgi:hypothetical protein